MAIKNLFYLSYWFSQPYIARDQTYSLWIGIILITIFIGIVALSARSMQKDEPVKKALGNLSSCLLTMGLLTLLWFFFRQQRVVVLGWRFWLIPLVFGTVYWLGKVLWYVFKRLPKIKADNAARELKNKYLPAK